MYLLDFNQIQLVSLDIYKVLFDCEKLTKKY